MTARLAPARLREAVAAVKEAGEPVALVEVLRDGTFRLWTRPPESAQPAGGNVWDIEAEE